MRSHLYVALMVGVGTFIFTGENVTLGWIILGILISASGVFYAGYKDAEGEK